MRFLRPRTGDTRALALQGLDLSDATGLEIGALNRPLLRRGAGRVFYADHWTTEALREKYAADPAVDVAAIVEVDFDLSAMRLADIGATTGPLDCVVASHVVEHVPDLAGWLSDIHGLLREGGVLALVVPDKRFTFDLHRRESTGADVEIARREARPRPGLDVVLDYFVNTTAAPDAGRLWRDYGEARRLRPSHPPEAIAAILAQWQAGAYLDAHCWVVTPWRFLDLVGTAVEALDLDFGLRRIVPTPRGQLEFYVQLERRPKGSSRTDWAGRARALARRSPRPELARF